MAPLSRRARRTLAVGAGAAVAYAAAVAYRRACDAELEAPDARTKRLEEAHALAALERELAALDEGTLRGSGASARPPPRGDHAGNSGDSLASGSGSSTSSLVERTRATASTRDGNEASSVVRRSADRTKTFRAAETESRETRGDDETDVKESRESAAGASRAGSGADSTPDFFASTKFFACLELEESRELFDDAAETIEVPPKAVVFRQGDDSSAGIYVVERGSLGVYLQEERATSASDGDEGSPPDARAGETGAPTRSTRSSSSDDPSDAAAEDPQAEKRHDAARRARRKTLGPPFLTNILREGESVGDIDVLDNAPRGVSVVAGAEGARLVRIGQKELFAFIRKHPRTLETYVTQAVARLWRVAHFVLVDFLGLPRPAAGDAVRLSRPDDRGEPEPTRLSPACALTKHVDALEKHCPSLRVDDAEEGADDVEQLLRSQKLYAEGERATCMFLVLSGVARADATPWPRGDGQRGPPASAPALLGASAFLTRSARQETVRVEANDASSAIRVLVVGAKELAALRTNEPEAYVAVLLASTCSLSRLLRQFISLGLNRVWLRAGESAYVAGEAATSMFVLISGRVRLLRGEDSREETAELDPRDGGSSSSASSSRGAYRARPDEERGRGETIGEAPLLANGRYPSTATCLRDSELVRMSRGALTLVCARHPVAASRLLEAMARKLHASLGPSQSRGASPATKPDLVTIALVPVSAGADEAATATLAASLRDALARRFGPTLWLDERAARDAFADGPNPVTRLENAFYRSKLTGWMAQQEENYRFILLQADASGGAWSQVCVSQADRVAVVARVARGRLPEDDRDDRDAESVDEKREKGAAAAQPSRAERRLLWRRRRGAAVELVLVHDSGAAPGETTATRRWRASRPEVQRHHMLRLSSDADVQRLARHVAGRAVGVVLTGGGGHGLAHLGALRALEDAGVPVDVVGGTSRGALVAALYAKHASTTHMLPRVKELVGVLSSPRHLLADLTLPILSVFSGKGLDAILRKTLGEDDVEDLWLPFFCCSTNLTRGRLSTHVAGRAWSRVRASMTTLGLLPPVVDERGELLVDGGYLNAIPVDVMRETFGADVVVVIDVEDDDYLAFRDLTPRDGGLGGWRLLWERVGGVPFAFSGTALDAFRNARGALERAFAKTSPSGPSGPARRERDASAGTQARNPPSGAGARANKKVSYASLLSALLRATSARQFAQASREHAINLYLRPPGASGWTAPLTPRRADALVRRAHSHACAAVAAWCRHEALAEARAAAADVGGPRAEIGPARATRESPNPSGRSSGASLAGFATERTRASSISSPSSSPARRSLELAVDRTGRADRVDRDDVPVGGANGDRSGLETTKMLLDPDPNHCAAVKAAARGISRAGKQKSRARSVTLPPPAAPGADEAATRVRAGPARSLSAREKPASIAESFSSARSSEARLSEASARASERGAPRTPPRDGPTTAGSLSSFCSAAESLPGEEPSDDATPTRRSGANATAERSDSRRGDRSSKSAATAAKARRGSREPDAERLGDFDAVLASSLLYRAGSAREIPRAGGRHVRRHSAHVDALSPGAPVFGALLARRAEEEDRWRRAFGTPGGPERAAPAAHAAPRRRSLSAGDLAEALAKEGPPEEVASLGRAA